MDAAHAFADEQVEEIKKLVAEEYRYAQKQAEASLETYLEKYKERQKKMKADLDAGLITKNEYDKWWKGEALTRNTMKSLVSQVAKNCNNANSIAAEIISGKLPSVAAEAYNFASYKVCDDLRLDVSFALQDAGTIAVLFKDKGAYMPALSVDTEKDIAWNEDKVASAVTQGVILGEPIPNIAQRINGVIESNYKHSVMLARTSVTAAENAGRLESYKDAESKGVKLEKKWLAALDSRTRHSHRIVDGESVGTNDKFSNGCRYPGDPEAPFSETANCRCTLIADIDGIKNGTGRWSRLPEGTTYESWRYDSASVAQLKKSSAQQLAASQAVGTKLQKLGKKSYTGLWANKVTLAQVAQSSKKWAIQQKIDYFNMRRNQTSGAQKASYTRRYKKALQLRDDFAEYKKLQAKKMQYSLEAAKLKAKAESKIQQKAAKAKAKAQAKKSVQAAKRSPGSVTYSSVDWRDYERLQKDSYNRATRTAYIESGKEIAKKLPKEELDGIVNYTGNWFTEMNQAMRLGKTPSPAAASFIENGTRAFEHDFMSLSADSFLFRETSDSCFNDLYDLIGVDELANDPSLAVGHTWSDPGFLSTTIKPGGTFSAGKGVRFHVYAPKGTRAMYVEPISRNSGEQEMLFKPGQKWIIRNLEHQGSLGYNHRYGRDRHTWDVWIEALNE